MRLDVGCGELGRSKLDRYRRCGLDPAHYLGVDRAPVAGVGFVADLDRPLPIAESAVEEIVAVHVLEHVLDLAITMREFHRVLQPEGLLRVWVPPCFSAIAFGDTTHRPKPAAGRAMAQGPSLQGVGGVRVPCGSRPSAGRRRGSCYDA